MDTFFVTGGSGFIGSAFVRHALVAGKNIQVLTRSEKSAERVLASGATPIMGDMLQAGAWQAAAAQAQVVVHLAQPETYGTRVTRQRALSFRQERLMMDANLLDALKPGVVQRVIYVGGTSYYGFQGDQLVDESATPQPKGWGPYIAPAIDALDSYLARGLPLSLAFPSWVYGPGSWFIEYTLEPLTKGKPIIKLPGAARTISFVHVEDVARAILHLSDHGETGRRYFITDDQPRKRLEIGEVAAKILGVRMKTLSLPMFLMRLAAGPVIAESMLTEACLSNARLKSTGFALDFPTLEQGVPDAIERWRKMTSA
jgi:nucleoside-diphosphate-sugar epimerase